MEALRADWRESLTRFEKEGAEARAEARAEAARDREAAAKERAEDRAAAARESAERKQENERLRTEIEKSSKWLITVNLAAIAVATGFLAFWLQRGG